LTRFQARTFTRSGIVGSSRYARRAIDPPEQLAVKIAASLTQIESDQPSVKWREQAKQLDEYLLAAREVMEMSWALRISRIPLSIAPTVGSWHRSAWNDVQTLQTLRWTHNGTAARLITFPRPASEAARFQAMALASAAMAAGDGK
jgi:hypothetical protein